MARAGGGNIERTFDVRLPKRWDAPLGLVFDDSPGEFVRKRGSLGESMVAKLPENSSAGVHASNDGKRALCTVPLQHAETISRGSPEQVAAAVTCKFCQTRLVNAGVLDPSEPHVSPWARFYGTGGSAK